MIFTIFLQSTGMCVRLRVFKEGLGISWTKADSQLNPVFGAGLSQLSQIGSGPDRSLFGLVG